MLAESALDNGVSLDCQVVRLWSFSSRCSRESAIAAAVMPRARRFIVMGVSRIPHGVEFGG